MSILDEKVMRPLSSTLIVVSSLLAHRALIDGHGGRWEEVSR
jgi:hypothetical protein